MAPLLAAVLGAVLAASPGAPDKPPPPERVAVEVDDPKLRKDIDDRVARSVAWLKARQQDDGSWPQLDDIPAYGGALHADRYKPELSALALLALLKSGVPRSDPCVTRAFAYLRKQVFPTSGAYGCGVTLMALEAAEAGEGAGEVSSPSTKQKGKERSRPSDDHAAWAAELVRRILGLQAPSGGWRYACPAPYDMAGGMPGFADVSATQYALLGLKAARRMGIPVDTGVFARAADFLMDQQEKDGQTVLRIISRTGKEGEDISVPYGDRCRGWPYMKDAADRTEATASMAMTCAGLAGMLICRSECLESASWKPADRAKRLSRMEQSVWDGLAWLDAHWAVDRNVPQGAYELGYALYALERVGMMADLRYIGPRHDWYVEGARVWISRMKEEGPDKGWWALGASRAKSETQDTPYGILFLKKASLRLGYPVGE